MTHWTLDYVTKVLESKGWSMNRLAQEAEVAASTINRPLREKDWPHGLAARTVAKIHRATGIDPAPFMPKDMEEPDSMYFFQSLGRSLRTTPDDKLGAQPDAGNTGDPALKGMTINEIKISVDGKIAQIVATLDRDGLAKLRAKIDAIDAMLDD